MGTLAYDPGQLGALRARFVAADESLTGLRCADAEAADAVALIRSIQASLFDVWIPLVDRILRCDPLGREARDPGDLRNALIIVMSDWYGWSLARDPLDDNVWTVSAEEARALGAILRSGDIATLIDTDAEVVWLDQQLMAIRQSPTLSAEFAANFDEAAMIAVCDALGEAQRDYQVRIRWDDPTGIMHLPATIDSIFGSLVREYERHHDASGSGNPSIVGLMSPYAASVVACLLDLDDVTFGRVADQIVHRWMTMDRHEYESYQYDVPFPADILGRQLVTRPIAASTFLEGFLDEPLRLWRVTDSWELPRALLVAGTTPSAIDAVDAERIIVTFISAIEPEGDVVDVHMTPTDGWVPPLTFLGTLLGPWLMQLSPYNHDWTMSMEGKVALLKAVVDNEGALAALVARADEVAAAELTWLAASGRNGATLEQVAGLIAMLGEIVVGEHVADEETLLAQWNMMFSMLTLPLDLLPIPVAADVSVGFGADQLQQVASDHGWLGAPQPDKVERAADYAAEWTLTVFAASALRIGFDRQRSAMPSGAAPPPSPNRQSSHPVATFVDDYLRWRADTFGDPPAAHLAAALADFDRYFSAVFAAAAGGIELAD